MRHNTRFATTTAAVAAAGALLAACGSSTATPPASPSKTVNNAFSADFNQPGLRATIRLATTPAVLRNGSHLSEQQAQAILASRVVLSVHGPGSASLSSGKQGGSAELTLVKSGTTLVDLRFVNTEAYARADLSGLASAYGFGQQSFAALGQLSSRVPALGALAAGKWISVNLKSVMQQLSSMGMTTSSTTPAERTRVLNAVHNLLVHSEKVTGSGQHYVLTFNDRAVVQQLGGVLAAVPGASALPQASKLSQAANRIPASRVTTLNATVNSGRVTRLSLPLNQFDTQKSLTGRASIDMALASAGPVAAPSGATPLDISQLIHMFSGLGTSSSGSASSSG